MHLIHAIFEPHGDGPHPTILALHGRGQMRSICSDWRRTYAVAAA